jgi:hypothetical protein
MTVSRLKVQYNLASIGPPFYTALAKNQSFLGRHGDSCCASGTGADGV